MNISKHTDIRTGLLVLVAVCLACTRVPRQDDPDDQLPRADREEYVSADPEGLPVTVLSPDGEVFDAFIDSLGTLLTPGVTFNGAVSNLHHGRFVMGTPGKLNVYSLFQPGQPLNTSPFSDLTDFRMGVAYGTRPGRSVMVVATNGTVPRILPDRVLAVSLPPAGTEVVDVETADVPLKGRLTATAEEFYRVTDSVATHTAEPAFWPSLELIEVGNGFSRAFRRTDGRSVGDFLIKPLSSPDRFRTAATDYINPAAASSIVDGITSTGWEVDSAFYSAATPGTLIAQKARISPLALLLRFNFSDDRVIALPRGADLPDLFFTFTAPPYSQSNTFGFLSLFATPRPDENSRLRTITMPVRVNPRLSRPMMKAAESLVMQRGFIGLSDKSHAFRGKGDTYLYFVPNDRGFFIVMSFGTLDYPTLMGSAMTPPANNTINHLNISL
ncbi:MAG: hypothetical protein HDT07_03885 [Bacteroidales bacterium]|nr:hypothetical protein [Bacteroidales bacterium]